MSKEMVVAILFGSIIGIFLTYGFYRARLALGPGSDLSPTPTPTTQVSPSPTANGQLTLISPDDESVQAEKSVTIMGRTLANATVVILVNDEEEVTMADETGNFSQARTLDSGSNIITVNVLDESGATLVVERTVIVANTEALNPAATATPSGQSNR